MNSAICDSHRLERGGEGKRGRERAGKEGEGEREQIKRERDVRRERKKEMRESNGWSAGFQRRGVWYEWEVALP